LSHAILQLKPLQRFRPILLLVIVAAGLLTLATVLSRTLHTNKTTPTDTSVQQGQSQDPSLQMRAGRPPSIQADPAAPGRRY